MSVLENQPEGEASIFLLCVFYTAQLKYSFILKILSSPVILGLLGELLGITT